MQEMDIDKILAGLDIDKIVNRYIKTKILREMLKGAYEVLVPLNSPLAKEVKNNLAEAYKRGWEKFEAAVIVHMYAMYSVCCKAFEHLREYGQGIDKVRPLYRMFESGCVGSGYEEDEYCKMLAAKHMAIFSERIANVSLLSVPKSIAEAKKLGDDMKQIQKLLRIYYN